MVTNTRCTTDMFFFLRQKAMDEGLEGVEFYKDDDKPSNYKGWYIAINCLPFTYGQPVNQLNAMNINLHCPRLNTGGPDRKQLEKLLDFICGLIPEEKAYEDAETLFLNGVHYAIHTQSRPMEDKDGTYFFNLRLSLTF